MSSIDASLDDYIKKNKISTRRGRGRGARRGGNRGARGASRGGQRGNRRSFGQSRGGFKKQVSLEPDYPIFDYHRPVCGRFLKVASPGKGRRYGASGLTRSLLFPAAFFGFHTSLLH